MKIETANVTNALGYLCHHVKLYDAPAFVLDLITTGRTTHVIWNQGILSECEININES
jgi:hypothetical protein